MSAATVCWTWPAVPALMRHTKVFCSTSPTGCLAAWAVQQQRHTALLTAEAAGCQQHRRSTLPVRAQSPWHGIRRLWLNRGCSFLICGQLWAMRASCLSLSLSMVALAHCHHWLTVSCLAQGWWHQPLCGSRGPQHHVQMTISAYQQVTLVVDHEPSMSRMQWHAPTTRLNHWQRSRTTNRIWIRCQSSGHDWASRKIRMFCRLWCGTGSMSWR